MSKTMRIALTGSLLMATTAPLARAQGSWVQQGKITPSVTINGSQVEFGASMATFDDWLLAGSFEEGGTGSAYVFELQGSTWVETYELYPDMLLPDDEFGSAVALTMGVAVVGAPSAFGSGAVHLFEGAGSAWSEVACFMLQPLAGGARFGAAVAVCGDVALAGAPGISRVVVLERSSGTWSYTGDLAPSGLITSEYGSAIAFDGTRAVVGAPGDGTAHVFERPGGSWMEVARLLPDDPDLEHFGEAVSLRGDEILIGAPENDGEGAAVVFALGPLGWVQTAELSASTAASSIEFGRAVVLGDDLAVVGAPADDGSGILGSAYVYERGGSAWYGTAVLLPDVGPGEGTFGSSVAIVDPYVLVDVGLNDSGVLGYAGAINVWGKVPAPVPSGSGPATRASGWEW